MKNPLLLTPLFLALALTAHAQSHPFQASLTPDIAIYSRDTQINGLSLSIWGENPQTGVALGFVNGSTGDSSGFSAGIVNYADDYRGVQLSAVNFASGNMTGWQNGFVNYAESISGFQSGFANCADSASGVQLGAFNYAGEMKGLQLGFFNIIKDNPWFSDFPEKLATGFVFANWSF